MLEGIITGRNETYRKQLNCLGVKCMRILKGYSEGDKTDWECPKCGKEFTAILAGWSLYFDSEKGTDYE